MDKVGAVDWSSDFVSQIGINDWDKTWDKRSINKCNNFY